MDLALTFSKRPLVGQDGNSTIATKERERVQPWILRRWVSTWQRTCSEFTESMRSVRQDYSERLGVVSYYCLWRNSRRVSSAWKPAVVHTIGRVRLPSSGTK